MYLIYALIHSNTVKYIGITRQTLEQRLQQHKNHTASVEKHQWLRDNIVEIKQLDTAPDLEMALILEEKYIKIYKKNKLFNKQKNGMSVEEAFQKAKACIKKVSKKP